MFWYYPPISHVYRDFEICSLQVKETKSKTMNLCRLRKEMKSVFKRPDDNLSISLGDFQNHWSASHFQCPHSQDVRTTWDVRDHAIQISQFRAGSLCFSGGWLDGGNVDGWWKEYIERGILSPLDTQRIEGLIRSFTRLDSVISACFLSFIPAFYWYYRLLCS